MPSGSRGDFIKTLWEERKAQIAKSKEEGNVTVTLVRGRLQVAAPYHESFVKGARALSGKWSPKLKVWTFKQESEAYVMQLIGEVYGTERSH